MTVYQVLPTVASGDSWSASQHNTYLRDNFKAVFENAVAGGLPYWNVTTGFSALAAPAATSYLQETSLGAFSWITAGNQKGALHTKGLAWFAPNQTFAGTWADITSATVTLTTTVTCSILVLANVTGYSTLAGTGKSFFYRSMVAGVADPDTSLPFNGSQTDVKNSSLAYMYYASGVAAGSVVVKLQCEADGAQSNYVTQGQLMALAFAE